MLSTFSHSDLQEAVQETLSSSAYLPLRRLTVTAEDGVVTLHGKVPSFYLKQLAQSLLKSISAIREIKNQVNVVVPDRQFSVRGASFGLDALDVNNRSR